jgi:predicted DNA-binding transcriptional regulator AlpA
MPSPPRPGGTPQPGQWVSRTVPLGQALPYLNLSYPAAYRLIRQGQFPIPVVKSNGRWYVRTADIDDIAARQYS